MSKSITTFLINLEKKLGRVSDYIGHIISWLFLPLIIVTFIVAALRYSLNFGVIWMQEITTYLHAIIVMACMGYTLRCEQHVRIDIFYAKFSEVTRAKVNLLGHIFLVLPFSITIIIISANYTLRSWQLMEKSLEAGGLPFVFILKTFIPLMAILLLTQSIADIAHNLRTLCYRGPSSNHVN